jgi:uncharacterized protein with beta-barrel porin domain
MSRLAALMASSAAVWAAGPAYGQCAVSSAPDGYVCAGTNTTPQTIVGADPAVSTSPGFGVDTTTTGGDALTITGTGGTLTYVDANSSTLTGASSGVLVWNAGTGATSVAATGDATGIANYGIFAANAQALLLAGDGSIDSVVGSAGTDLTVSANNVSGGIYGIHADNLGTGATSVTATGTVTGTAAGSYGIAASNSIAGTDVTVSANNVSGASFGIWTLNEGTGKTSVTATGAVAGNYGIVANNRATGTDLMVSANNVSGVFRGLSVQNSGTGTTSVTATGTVTATAADGYGIDAANDKSATDLTVSANNVSGVSRGIVAQNSGTGATRVTATGTVIGTAADSSGIGANGGKTGTDLTVSANNVSGGIYGIHADNLGTGATSVAAAGTVIGTAAGSYGIAVSNDMTGTDLTISANNVSGRYTGIVAENRGTGTTSVTATGNVTGTANYGILAVNGVMTLAANGQVQNLAGPAGTDLTVSAASATGGQAGIRADNLGIGETRLIATGTVIGTAAGSYGIDVHNYEATTGLTVSANNVRGASRGILAQNDGAGATSVTAAGSVIGTAADSYGIDANNGAISTDLTVSANDVRGGLRGILAQNFGSGATAVTTTGSVIGTGAGSDGIDAFNDSSATDLTVSANNVSGGSRGILAQNSGTGATNVTATGTVIGTAADSYGIDAYNGVISTDLTVSANDARGGLRGILAQNFGSGATVVTSTGSVIGTGAGSDGIDAYNDSSATDLTVAANNVSGRHTGIVAENRGTGATSVTAAGNVTGTANYGILAVNAQTFSLKPDGSIDTITGAAGTDLTINAASVTGQQAGILARNNGTGSTNVSATGTVIATAVESYGILAANAAGGTKLTIAANDVSGRTMGIFAQNEGVGITRVVATGTVTGTGEYSYGIYAANGKNATDLSVAANNVSGSAAGIFAANTGTGSTLIAATGAAAAATIDGIFAYNAASARDLTVTANNVSGGAHGLNVRNLGIGATAVITTGTVAGTGAGSDGVDAYNDSSATDLTVAANTVSGRYSGIVAENRGTGTTSVTATGNVTGTANYGILAVNGTMTLTADGRVETLTGPAGTDLTVSAASVTGGQAGIFAENSGIGATKITATGTATATAAGSRGIFARNAATATDLTVAANNTSGRGTGISAENFGTGATNVTTTGTVTGTVDYGISAYNNLTATDLTVDANNVSGGAAGILARNSGTGVTNVTAAGNVTGTANYGILAVNAQSVTFKSDGSVDEITGTAGTDLTVNATSVTGGLGGIDAQNKGTGATNVTATGAVIGTSSGSYGILAANAAGGTSLTIAANDVSGRALGILAENDGVGTTRVAATGTVTGTAEFSYGIYAVNGKNTTDLSVAANNVSGSAAGILAANTGTGSTLIAATGAVAATTDGIFAFNDESARSLTVTANDVSGGAHGLNVRNLGSGATAVTTTGSVIGTGAGSDGIDAFNDSSATDLAVAANNVSGRYSGVVAENRGTGATSVSATGDVIGTANYGILATNAILTLNADGTLHDVAATTGTDLTVNAASVTGGQTGIYAWNAGIGATSVTATGDVAGTSAGSYGIAVFGDTGTTDLTIAANNVSGGQVGLVAQNAGTGATNIVTTGNVTGTAANSEGIYAHVYAATNGLTVSANNASGVGFGILAQNDGAGATSVAATGAVTGTGGGSTGIAVYNQTATTGLAVNANNVSGGSYAIDTENIGTGATSIAATGTVTSAAGIGIHAYNAANTTDLTIAANNASGGFAGIYAQNDGTGTTSVTANGAVTGTAADGYGIYAYNDTIGTGVTVNIGGAGTVSDDHLGFMAARTGAAGAAAADLSGNAASATGGYAGIFTENSGTGTTSITTGGIVQGGHAAIAAKSSAGQAIGITNNGTVSNSSGGSGDLAVLASGGPLTLTNNNILTGIVAVDDGATAGFNDMVTNNASWNSIGGVNAFGGGRDAVINGTQGIIVGGTSAALAEVTRFTGLETLSNNGVITMADSGVGDVVHTDGAASFAAGSVLAIDVGSNGQSDVFAADGAVTLAPGARLTVTMAGKPVLGTRDTVLTAAGGLTGTFELNNPMLTAFAGFRGGYTATSAYVEVAQLRPLAAAGQTRNQIATAAGIDGIAGASPLRDAIVMLPDDATARGAFDQLSGEAYASVRSVMTLDTRLPRNAVLERLSDGHEGGAVWGQALRNWGDSDGDGNAARVDRNSNGVLAGADLALGSSLTVGVAGGYLDTDLKIPGRGTTGSVKTIHALGYIGAHFGGFALRAGAGYAWADVDMRRRVSFAGFSDGLQSSYNGSLLQGFAEMGYRIPLGTGYAEPFAGITAVRASTDGFAEKGGAAALNVARAHENSTISTAGIRFETALAGPFSLRGAVGWQHGFGRLEPLNVAAFSGGQPFTVSGVAQSRNAGIANIEARFRLSPGASIGISYDGVLGTGGQDHAVKAGLTIAF